MLWAAVAVEDVEHVEDVVAAESVTDDNSRNPQHQTRCRAHPSGGPGECPHRLDRLNGGRGVSLEFGENPRTILNCGDVVDLLE
jgi:hypothetical protein